MENGSRVLFKLFVLLACLLGAFALLFLRPSSGRPSPQPYIEVQRMSMPAHVRPARVEAAALVSPARDLDGSDSLVRELVVRVSSHPRLAAWLINDDLVRRFVASVEDVASGYSPWQHLGFLRPVRPFQVRERDGRLVISQATYGRYDLPAEVFASIDAEDAIELYVRLRPLCEAAHREISPWNSTFDQRLGEAIAHLLEVEVPDRSLAVEARTITFAYADPAFENLTDAQRHLVRMGPRNMRLVQTKLRDLQQALAALETPQAEVPAARIVEGRVDRGATPAVKTSAGVARASWPPARQGPW